MESSWEHAVIQRVVAPASSVTAIGLSEGFIMCLFSDGIGEMRHARTSLPVGSSAVVGSFVASEDRRRGGGRGPVALRPRLSPGVPLSRDWCGGTDHQPRSMIDYGAYLAGLHPGSILWKTRRLAWGQIPM